MAVDPNDPTAATGVFAPNPHPLGGADTVPAEPTAQPNAPTGTGALTQHHPSAIKNEPDNFVERLSGLTKVHPWMPFQAATALALQPIPDTAVASMAADLRKTYGSVDMAIKYVTDDPVLEKQPSLAMSIRSYLTNTIGPWPVADSDLVSVQKNLQAQGFGKTLPPNGTWGPAWNSAFDLWSSNLRAQALGGAQPGSMPVGQALRGLNQLMPQQSATSIGAFIAHMPDSVVQDLHTAAGAIAGGANALYQGFQPKNLLNPHFTPNRKEEAGAEATAENASTGGLAVPITSKDAFSSQGFRKQSADVLQVAGDILATHGLLKAGSAVADAAGDTQWTRLDPAAAQRGPGTVAKKFFGPVAEGDNMGKPLLSRGAAENVPMLRMAGPVADKIAGANGYYYRARTLLAAPYAIPGVKVAGEAVGQLGLAGAKVRGLASLESVVGGQQSPETQAINNFQYVNQANDAINNRLKFTAWGHHFTVGINDLAIILHPPITGPGTISDTVGGDVTGINDGVQSALGPGTGLGISIERGVNWTAHGDEKLTYNQLVDQAGGQAAFAQSWSKRLQNYAAVNLAEEAYEKLPVDEQIERGTPPGATYSDRMYAIDEMAQDYIRDAIKTGDWSQIERSLGEMVSNENARTGKWGGHNGLSRRIAADIDRSGQTPKDFLQAKVVNHAAGSKLMRDVVVPRQAEVLMDDVPDGTLGMAGLDYKTYEQATTDINKLEKNYQTALDAVRTPDEETTAQTAWQNLDQAADAIRFYLKDTFGVDGDAMPQDDSDMIKLAREKAERQAHRIFPNGKPVRIEPKDGTPSLMPNPPPQPSTLERHTNNPVFSKMTPAEAVEFFHEPEGEHEIYPFTNSRKELERGAGHTLTPGANVIVEHDPKSLYGNTTAADYTETGEAPLFDKLRSEAQGVGSWEAQRQGVTGFNGVRSVEFTKLANKVAGKQASEQTWLENQLEDAGFVKFDKGNKVRYVRPGLVGGTVGTSPQMAKAIAQLKELGYQPVQGRGIGLDFYDSPIFDVADSKMTWRRRAVEQMGLSPENISSVDPGFTWNMNFNRNLLEAAEKYQGRVTQEGFTGDSVAKGDELRLYPTHTVQTIIARLRDRDKLPGFGGTASFIQHTVGAKAYAKNLDLRTQELIGTGMRAPEAKQEAARRMQMELDNPGGLAHVTMKDIRTALKRPPQEGSQTQRAAEVRGIEPTEDEYDEQAARAVYRAIQKTNLQQPIRFIGWQKAENVAAYGLSYAGRKITGGKLWTPEYLPTRLITLRNRARFTLSPEFALRRSVKVQVKMALDGVSPTWFPLRALEKSGQEGAKASLARLDRIMPEYANAHYDDGTQILYADDPWGWYPHRNFEAYYAREMAKMGKTDTEIRQGLVKDFGYGSKAYGEGRSALERSANFVFFPLSFDKTLYRNSGMFLLDHVAQRMVLQAGLQMYQKYNNSDPNGTKLMSSNWWLNHEPLVNEALRLNAFAHGIGLGEFGGINAPLLNLFIPQSYASSSQGVTLLKGYIPAVKEFQQLLQESSDTFNIARQVTADQLMHNPTIKGFSGKNLKEAEVLQGIFDAKPVAETQASQVDDAYQYRRQLSALLATQIDYNAHHSTDKLTLGTNTTVFGQYTGEVIDAALINALVHQKYPAYAPASSEIYYAQEAAAINSYSQQMKNAGHSGVVTWIADAQKWGNHIQDSTVDTATQAQATKIYRQYAVQYAETIPGFLDFYNSNFRWQFGPLEGVR